jgi:hypothetical protein
MTLFLQYFVPCKQLYMLWLKYSPIIRSSNKLLLQLVTTRRCNNSLFELLMMGECFNRNM